MNRPFELFDCYYIQGLYKHYIYEYKNMLLLRIVDSMIEYEETKTKKQGVKKMWLP